MKTTSMGERMFKTLIVAAVMAGSAFSCTPPAYATPTTDAFIDDLNHSGLQILKPDMAIKYGQWACEALDFGVDEDMLTNMVAENQEFSHNGAVIFLNASARWLCPQHSTEISPVLKR